MADAIFARLRLSAVANAHKKSPCLRSWTLLELSDLDRRRLVLAAEIYTETQPQFWHLTGQYARLTGKEVEAMDNTCQITLETLTPDRPLQPVT